MSITTTLLKGQDIHFENHNRGKSVDKLDGIHFHKKITNKQKRYSTKAWIKIYIDERTKWEISGEESEKLENELRSVFDKMPVADKIEFADSLILETEKFFSSEYLTNEKRTEISNNIFKTFFDLDKEIIESKQFQHFFYDYSRYGKHEKNEAYTSEILVEGHKYRVTFIESNTGTKIISIKDISGEDNNN